MNYTTEVWKDVKGFNGDYRVSSMGRVKSFKNGKEHFLKLKQDRRGYLFCSLCNKGKQTYPRVHRIVAEAFLENPCNKPTVNHLNGVKTDNTVGNLEWATNLENNLHAVESGLTRKGEACSYAKLTEKEARDIKYKLSKVHNGKYLAKMFNVCPDTIYSILHNRSWKHI